MGRADNSKEINTDSANIRGRLFIDTTSSTIPRPVTITHSNSYGDGSSYGAGSLFIETKSETNNQPLQINLKHSNSNTLGNAANLVIENSGGESMTDTSAFDVDIEFVANNDLVNAYNGKTELRQSSGRNTGDTRLRDGYFQISPRRGPLHPSGANTGFEPIFWFLPATSNGLGMFETKGNGIKIDPTYDYSTQSLIDMTNPFQDSHIINKATLSGKFARFENEGRADSYIRSRSMEGQAALYIQSETGNNNAYLAMRSNWSTGTTGGCILEMLTDVNTTGYRQGTDANGNFYIRTLAAGVARNAFNISRASNGLATFTNTANNATGRIRLSDGSGASGGGILQYSSVSGVYSFQGGISTTGGMTIAGNINPSVTEVFDLGSAANEWNNIYSQNLLTVSDRTKKEDISGLRLGLDFVTSLQPVSYKYKATGTPGIGLIAQDLLKVCEKFGVDSIVNHNDGKDYTVKYLELIPILINAIKELHEKVQFR